MEPSPGQLSSDAGLLPIRQFDQRLGLTRAFAALDDPRDPELTENAFLVMVRGRFGIVAGYEDQNDHDTLRADPDGGKGRSAFGASPGRMGVPIGLETSGRQPCDKGFE
jgi:hypothetical protein